MSDCCIIDLLEASFYRSRVDQYLIAARDKLFLAVLHMCQMEPARPKHLDRRAFDYAFEYACTPEVLASRDNLNVYLPILDSNGIILAHQHG